MKFVNDSPLSPLQGVNTSVSNAMSVELVTSMECGGHV